MNGQVAPAGGRVLGTGTCIVLIAAAAVMRFALPAGSPHGLNVHVAGVIVIGAAVPGLLVSLLWGPLNPAPRRRASPRGHDSGTSVLVRPEKRLYLGELPLAAERGLHREQPPL